MKNVYAYTPEFCDGDFCPLDCDRCSKREAILEATEEEPYDLEVGFDPYLGCYTDDC